MTPLHIVQCPCPEYKLVLRQAQCLIRLAQYKEGLLALHKCQATLNCSKLSDDKKAAVVKDIAALETEAVKLESKPTKTIEQSSTMELNSPEMPGASKKLGLEVSTDRVKGRFVTAKEDVEVINLSTGLFFYLICQGGRGFIPRVSLQQCATPPLLLQPL